MKGRFFQVLLLFLLAGNQAFAQPSNDNCINALALCPNITFNASNQNSSTEICANCADGTSTADTFCFALNNTIWFSFTTNTTGGNAQVDLAGITCLSGAGNAQNLQAVIVEATTPCDASTYTSVSNCISNGSGTMTLNAAGLLPSTTYYIQIDGDLSGAGITNPAECDFSILVSGAAVSLSATTTVTDQTCGNTDGQISVDAISGGAAPFQYSINGGAFQSSNVFSNLSAGTYIIRVTDNSGCIQNVDTVVVNQLNAPANGVENVTQASCNAADGSVQITGVTGGTAPYDYSINGGPAQASDTFTGLSAGNYTVIVSDQQACTQTISFSIPNNTNSPNVTATVTNTTCGNSDGAIDVQTVSGTAPFTYSLNGAAAQPDSSFTGLATGTYTVLVTDANGCIFQINGLTIAENPGTDVPQISISAAPNPSCVGDNVVFSSSVVNGGSSPNYEWFVNGVSVQNGATSTYSDAALNSGDVVNCVMTSSDPCLAITTATSNSQTMSINPVVNPTVNLVSSASSACSTDPVTFTATQNGCTGTATYQWVVNGSPVASDTTGIVTTTLPSTSAVSVNMSCSDVCSTPASSNTVNVTVTTVVANAGPDQVIATGSSAQLQGSGGGTYSWSPSSTLSSSTSPNPMATPGATTTYFLTVTVNGCTDQDEVVIVVTEPIYVYNSFTPNGDGTNDLWEIYNAENYPNCKVTVYDRWGQKVFNSIGYTNASGWDGTNHGLYLPAATYYYVIDLNSGGGKDADIFSGSITIIH